MVENIGLHKASVLATLQSQSITPVGVHEDELGVMLLVEVAVTLHELVIILVEVFAQFGTCLMCFSLVVVEFLICFRESYIQHGSFLLLRLDCQRRESGTVLANIRKEAELTAVHNHRAVAVKEHNILRERTGRHISLRGFRLDGYCRDFRLTDPTAGDKISFGLFDVCFSGSYTGGFCRLPFKTHFLQLTMGNRHHGLIETIDGRVVIPIQ